MDRRAKAAKAKQLDKKNAYTRAKNALITRYPFDSDSENLSRMEEIQERILQIERDLES
ncbi:MULTISPECIES: hypothetical protein [unclassified Adlercreutzia]|uniref:hypothetical protein n=1 Tax=unclassified Adlercreutzia TaxID=2636013 RepID=UPI0013EB27E4|nr:MULTISPECIES: hypothetical protein [unclassified Adlercreutzia]